MGAAVTITRTDHTPAELRGLAAKSVDADKARRLLAIAMVLEGTSRLDASRQSGMDRQAGQAWPHSPAAPPVSPEEGCCCTGGI